MRTARLHDDSTIPVTRCGTGPAVFLPLRTEPHDAAAAESLRQWGGDPELGTNLVDGLSDRFTVVTADYEGHRLAHPAARTLTPDHVVADLLTIADAAGVDRFAYYGYSWLALSGLQLALRTDRLWGLVMGGYPPIDGPYAAMLAVTRAAHAMAVAAPAGVPDPSEVTPGDWDTVSVQPDPDVTAQFVTLYEALTDFRDAEAQSVLTVPRAVFAGADDTISYNETWGDTVVRIAEPIIEHRASLTAQGWRVEVLPGLDHLGAMHSSQVLPLLRRWFTEFASA